MPSQSHVKKIEFNKNLYAKWKKESDKYADSLVKELALCPKGSSGGRFLYDLSVKITAIMLLQRSIREFKDLDPNLENSTRETQIKQIFSQIEDAQKVLHIRRERGSKFTNFWRILDKIRKAIGMKGPTTMGIRGVKISQQANRLFKPNKKDVNANLGLPQRKNTSKKI